MSIILGSIVLLGSCLFAFVYFALRGLPAVGFKRQKQALAFVLIAGVLVASSSIRDLTDSLLGDDDAGSSPASIVEVLLVDVLAASLLLLAALVLIRSERVEISPLRRSASLDPLTSLHNQAHFRRAAARRIIQSREYEIPLSLAMLDIDDFQFYKDSFGRDASNDTLRNVADILKRSVRADDLVARYSGEEFVMILNCELDDASIVFERVRSNVESYSGTPDAGSPVTVSIGLTNLGAGTRISDEIEEIIVEADTALYRAKQDGKNRVVSYPEVA